MQIKIKSFTLSVFFILSVINTSCLLEGEPIVSAPRSVSIKASDNSQLKYERDDKGEYYLPLKVGKSIHLEAVVYPSDADNTKVLWYTSNAGIATVDNGLVTAISLGDVTISAVTEMAAREKNIKIKVIE